MATVDMLPTKIYIHTYIGRYVRMHVKDRVRTIRTYSCRYTSAGYPFNRLTCCVYRIFNPHALLTLALVEVECAPSLRFYRTIA